MKRLVLVFSFSAALAMAQAPPTAQFEVASVKQSPDAPPDRVSVGVHVDGSQVRYTYLTLRDYIRYAFKVKDYQISAPDSANSTRFDIAAKMPDGATKAQVPDMLENLLVTRFEMKFHHDIQPLPVEALEVANGGLKLTPSPVANADPNAATNVAASGSAAGVNVDLGGGAYYTIHDTTFEVKKLTMQQIADVLARFMNAPVIDKTNAPPGTYDFTLTITPEQYNTLLIRSAISAGVALPPQALRALDGASDDSLMSALNGVGLKLENRKEPIDRVVIDSIDKAPVGN